MENVVFHIGEKDAPLHIVHHVGAKVPEDGKWHKVEERLTRKIFIDGIEGEELSSYVSYNVQKQEHTNIDDLTVGYTHETNPRIKNHRRLEIL